MFEITQRRQRRPRSNRRGGNRKRKTHDYTNGENSCDRNSTPVTAPIQSHPENPDPGQQVSAGHRSSCSSSAPASASNGESGGLNPMVAKLLRGESLPMSPQSIQLIQRFSEVKGPEYYVEQIQICVANPGRFLASWTLLVSLFGEAKLYDFVRDARWSEDELKQFLIKEEDY